MTTETHYFDGKKDNNVVQTKLELIKEGEDKLKGFRVTFWDRVFECELTSNGGVPSMIVRSPSEEEKTDIRKEGFKNVGKVWTEAEVQRLVRQFTELDKDLLSISMELERTERSVRMKLISEGLLKED